MAHQTCTLHVGLVLPFWLSLAPGEREVRLDGKYRRVIVANDVWQLDVGDDTNFPQGRPIHWTTSAEVAADRSVLAKRFPSYPITARRLKTVVTNVLEIVALSPEDAISQVEQDAQLHRAETLALVNRLIEVFSTEVLKHHGLGHEASRLVGPVFSTFQFASQYEG